MQQTFRTALIFAAVVASAGTAQAVDYSGGYVYWPGHFEGSYRVNVPDTTIGDESVRIDPVAILSAVAEGIARSQEPVSDNDRDASRAERNFASGLCSSAALERVEGTDGVARIDAVHRFGNLYAVRGNMENTSGRYRFTCSATAGSIQNFDIKPIKLAKNAQGPEFR